MDLRGIARSAGIDLIEPAALIRSADMARLLSELRSRHAIILGLEGFELRDGTLVPRMDLIADFSSLSGLPAGERSASSIRETEGFLAQEGLGHLVFDVTLD